MQGNSSEWRGRRTCTTGGCILNDRRQLSHWQPARRPMRLPPIVPVVTPGPAISDCRLTSPMPVDKSSARVRRMFGEIAWRYDFLNHLLSLGIDRSWRRRTVRLVPPVGDTPILDVCTGTADLALAYWRAGGRRVPIVGADFCRPMLAIARRKCRKAGATDEIKLVEADARRLPFTDGTFQIVCAAFGLRNVSDTDEGLREMVRVCRGGGRVAVLEFSMPEGRLLGLAYRWYFRRVLPRVGQALARNAQGAYNYLPASVRQFPEGRGLIERMRSAGLSNVRAHRFTRGIATLYVGEK
jgi:demethylmenaquinone methyltransferase/2-methoxy-6-polyprenyl-1,4-benzoquinol methylase